MSTCVRETMRSRRALTANCGCLTRARTTVRDWLPRRHLFADRHTNGADPQMARATNAPLCRSEMIR